MTEDVKKTAEELMVFKGKVRGEKFRTHAAYINQKEGEEGLRAIEKRLEELGYPFKFDDIRSLDWYPAGYSPLIMILAKDIFGWTDKDIFDMGYSAPKYSFIFKMALRWAISVERMAEESPSYWRKHYDFGEIEAADVDNEKKQVVSKISGFKLHPIMCSYLQGYILRMLQYVIKDGDNAKIKETKCIHKGDPYEEYVIKW